MLQHFPGYPGCPTVDDNGEAIGRAQDRVTTPSTANG
ncbi:hypothetical protein QF034_004224 [Streptomyces africanus]|uniref:Uncharacterized protein n=1 Tax=Streptomyces africanus TaxID=231024 RepID=A0ABU0QRH1_9ACTN|nr:hypothetical protein [Streptomyces africanus]